MKTFISAIALFFLAHAGHTSAQPNPIATGLPNPSALTVSPQGRVFVAVQGKDKKEGVVLELKKNQVIPFARNLNEPRGLLAFQNLLFVAEGRQVYRIDPKGKLSVLAAPEAFPTPPSQLHTLAVDIETGTLFASDRGSNGQGGAIFRIDPKGKVALVVDQKSWPKLQSPAGLAMDGQSFLLVADAETGTLHRLNLATKATEQIAAGLGSADALAWDRYGRLFIADGKGQRLLVIPRPGEEPVVVKKGAPADAIVLAPNNRDLLVLHRGAGDITTLPAQVPGAEVDETPMALEPKVAFPDLKWEGWQGETAKGTINFFKPLVLTHAGDGSNRIFVATQHGVIHVFPNDPKAKKSHIVLDIQNKVRYLDKENEEGFLGLAFHPKFKENGEFFVFYTLKNAKLENVLARYKMSKDDPSKADPASEEILLRVQRPFWNHDGGTIAFGPDGYLYVALGDGGSANDPFNNAQNPKSILGKILRLDVDRKDPGLPYAIPKDNPFVDNSKFRPETWAYGLRNVWRMAFDRKTGQLWAADVGQNLFEEINLIEKGGNYGWKLREGLHPFFPQGVGPRKDLIDPIWEYHHDIGRSITGGLVYRGKNVPELAGHYLYADYVSSKIWALRYDEAKKRVTANRPIPDRSQPIMSFGEDEQGEAYFLIASPTGQGIWQFGRK